MSPTSMEHTVDRDKCASIQIRAECCVVPLKKTTAHATLSRHASTCEHVQHYYLAVGLGSMETTAMESPYAGPLPQGHRSVLRNSQATMVCMGSIDGDVRAN